MGTTNVQARKIKYIGSLSRSWTEEKVGKIESTKYILDVHWYEKAGNQYKIKLKHRKGK